MDDALSGGLWLTLLTLKSFWKAHVETWGTLVAPTS
jgi:hypothetical protein